jgi:hypothetical protein
VSAGQAVDEPGVDRAEHQVAALGSLAGAVDVVQEPLHLGAGEVGVEEEAGALAEQWLKAAGAEALAEGSGAAVLPDDGVGDGTAVAVPYDGGLPLVGDADGGDVGGTGLDARHNLAGGVQLRLPDRLGVVLHPAGLRVDLLERLLGGGDDRSRAVKEDGAGGGCALVQGEDEFGHDADKSSIRYRTCRGLTSRFEALNIASKVALGRKETQS